MRLKLHDIVGRSRALVCAGDDDCHGGEVAKEVALAPTVCPDALKQFVAVVGEGRNPNNGPKIAKNAKTAATHHLYIVIA